MTVEEFRRIWEHTFEIPVAWGDMDALGHVNNVQYFRYFESARLDFLRDFQELFPASADGVGPILAYIDCRFAAPLAFPDTVLVGSQVRKIGNTSVRMSQSIYSLAQQKVVAGGDSVLVVVNYMTGEKIRVPDNVRDKYSGLD
jgi:acyl-CoA thioester hydrolase